MSNAKEVASNIHGHIKKAPLIGGLFGGGGDGADKAAEGARDIAGRYGYLARDYGNLYGDLARETQGMFGSSQDLWGRQYGQGATGAMEEFYKNYGSQFQQPTETSRAMNQFGTNFNNMNFGLNAGGYQAKSQLGQPSQQGQFYQTYGQQLAHPGRSNQAYADSSETYKQPGGYENWAGAVDTRFNNMNADTERRNNETYAQLQKEGRAEQYRPETVNRMSAMASALPGMQGTAQVESGASEMQGMYRDASQPTDYYNSQQRALQGPGAYEQFVQNDIYGRNPAKDMAMKEGLATVNQQISRRGGFNSGAAMTGIGQFVGKMEAEDYQNRANRAAQAQGMEMGRIGQGTQTAQAAAQGQLAQGSALQGLAGQRDTEKRARLDQVIGVNQAASGEQLASNRLGLDSATAADQARMSRLGLGLQANNQGADQRLNAMRLQSDIQRQSQQFGMDRAGANVRDAGQADQSQLARLMGGYNMSQGADADQRARAMAGFDVDQGMYSSGLQGYGMYGNLTGQQDQQSLARLMGMGNMAGNAQNAQMGRYGQAFDSQYGMNRDMANLWAEISGQGLQTSGRYNEASLGALANMYGLQGQAIQDRQEAPLRVANTAIAGIKAVKGAG
jgi:hypothetical protein